MDDADIQLMRDLAAGRACRECGDPITPAQPCETCARKREILRAAFPEIFEDA